MPIGSRLSPTEVDPPKQVGRSRWSRGRGAENSKTQIIHASLEKTFSVLAKTPNEAAVNVLVPALDSALPACRNLALCAILDRRSVVGQREILRRLDTIEDPWKSLIVERRGRMGQALRDAVLGSDEAMFRNACQAILAFREYDLTSALVTAMEDDSNPRAPLAARTVMELATQLYDDLAGPRNYQDRRDPQLVRRRVIGVLEQSVKRLAGLGHRELLESFLVLVHRDNATLKQILLDPHHSCYLHTIETLTNSPQIGTIRLLLGFLDDRHAPSSILNVISHRSDLRFLNHLLHKIAEDHSAALTYNLGRLEHLAWAWPENPLLAYLDDEQQALAIRTVMAAGMARDESFRFVAHLLVHGDRLARRTAATALAEFPGAEANDACLAALLDNDPAVQAEAVRQLRGRGVPGVMPRIIEALSSPYLAVVAAARESLSEFSFSRFVAMYDTMDDEARRGTGLLVAKVDPEARPLLVEELHCPIRARRLRAIELAVTMGIVAELQDDLIDVMFEDEDQLVRVRVAQELAACPTDGVEAALIEAQGDRSRAVRTAARESLAVVQQARAGESNGGPGDA